ncbi:flagellar biosynthesis protein FlhA [Aquamicrobium zhengzhouense]|uniref:Flagellar biosynthesis protein FlhA n=1 Tax=Aquamicrobium zhengzhouense TaxID=2781738 RepID=A0ABS0S8V2_9HYPH|nr:flagellar biosynthesis protein FlhA [Aquamicrobium zhengzhouense]MBI1619725.1 flagellar biosynthesis protein FlhA [Aquamicrobium zhengzhouense]
MAVIDSAPVPQAGNHGRDIALALGVITILSILFLPIPPFLIDFGLALSLAVSVLILMVALWMQKPLDFTSFPTVLLIVTMLRLSLSIATTRAILSHGNDGVNAAGYVIGGFSNLVMAGDFVIGLIVFLILIVVNFIVITKGATRIAEVGARFTLDAIPGKQMSIDADLSAGVIDDKEAQKRRRELEEESSFFGAMDGASKFVRGDAIAGLLITAINIIGGIAIGYTRHGMSMSESADVFVKLSVGDGLATQIPALIVSLSAGLVVSKGGTRGATDEAVFGQLGAYPRALSVAAVLIGGIGIMPGLPTIPFFILAFAMGSVAYFIPRQRKKLADAAAAAERQVAEAKVEEEKQSIKASLKTPEIELLIGKQLSTRLLTSHQELAFRMGKMRKKFATQYGFVVPEVKLTDDFSIPPKTYQIKIHGTVVAEYQMRVGEVMVLLGNGTIPQIPGEEVREPAFGMRAYSVSEAFAEDLKRERFTFADNLSVLLTHLSEVIRNNLPQLLSYKDMKALIERQDQEYRKLIDEVCTSHISYPGLQAVLKLLLAERISIRNLHLIIEAIAEIAPHVRRTEQIVEHVRIRMAQQICGDLTESGVLKVLRLGNRWDLAFHQALKRDQKGEIREFDIDPRLLEEFGNEMTKAVRQHLDAGERFVLVTAPDARPYVRMIVERLFATLPVLSHVEIARGVEVRVLGSIS